MIFSIIYWAAGGTGRCYCETATVLLNTTTASLVVNESENEDFSESVNSFHRGAIFEPQLY